MKTLIIFTILNLSHCMAQSQSDLEAVNNIIIAFQGDFNEGGFKNAHSYTTPDWVHINPGGGVTRGRKEVLEEVIAVP
jgi:hypothetical protein